MCTILQLICEIYFQYLKADMCVQEGIKQVIIIYAISQIRIHESVCV